MNKGQAPKNGYANMLFVQKRRLDNPKLTTHSLALIHSLTE